MGKATDEELTAAMFECVIQCLKAPDRAACVAQHASRLSGDKGWSTTDRDTIADGAQRVFDLIEHRTPEAKPAR